VPETYAAALTDPTVNKAKVPAATYKMNADGTLSPIIAQVTVASVSAVNGTIAVGGTTAFTFIDSTGAPTVPTGVTYSVISSNASTGSVTNGVFTATVAVSYTIQATIGSVNLTTGVTVTATPAAFAVSSASSLNGSQVNVTFNEAVDATAGAKAANYSLKTAAGAAVEIDNVTLSTDKMTATLTIGTGSAPIALAASTSYTVTVAKDLTNSVAPALTAALSASFTAVADVSVPTVTGVSAIGNSLIRVTFSKPVVLNGTAKKSFAVQQVGGSYVAGQDYSTGAIGAAYTTNAAYNSVDLKVAVMPVGTYYVQAIAYGGTDGINDANGTILSTVSNPITVTAATAVAQATGCTVTDRTHATLTFDNPVESLPSVADVFWNTDGTTTTSNAVATSLTPSLDGKSVAVVFTTGSTTSLPVGPATVVVKGMKDANGNTIPTTKFQVTATASAAVTTTSVAQNDANGTASDRYISVTFSAPVQNVATATGDVRNLASYSLQSATGTTLTSADSAGLDSNGHPVNAISWDTTNNTATIDLGSGHSLPGGTYNVVVANVKDTFGVVVANQTNTFTVTDTTPPTYTPGSFVATTGKVVLTYSEPMAVTGVHSMVSASNYQWDVAGNGTFVALPTGTTLTASNSNKTVTIALPSGKTFTSGLSVIKAGYDTSTANNRLSDVAGNLLAVDTVQTITTSSVVDLNGATIKITSPTTATLTLSSPINPTTLNAADFKFTNTAKASFANADLTPASVTADSTSKILTFTFAAGTFSGNDYTTSKVRAFLNPTAANVSTSDSLGNKVVQSDADGTTTELVANGDLIKPMMTAVAIENATTVVLTFDGNLSSTTSGDFVVAQGTTTLIPTSAVVGAGTSQVVLTLGTGLDLTSPVTVKTVPQDLIGTTGMDSAFMAVNTTGIVSTTSAMLSSVAVTNVSGLNNIEATDSIDLAFNRNLDPTSILSGWDGTSSKTVVAGATFTTPGAITLSISGVGTVSGFTSMTLGSGTTTSAAITLSMADAKTLHIIFGAPGSTVTSVTAPTSTIFTPVSTIKTTSGQSVSTAPVKLTGSNW